ncbi:hypothetical protein NC653_011646 [Populus alba x Populus x berolinensis]|uniref:F-box family protein n=1 Tax=Populus alba x Populus x berolinensis TaxID=444605 RepID=A0AAD6R2M8_9ROSI|nr:hypothetical protein NC653_011646 [Populus alba x Populus x berolinensis]
MSDRVLQSYQDRDDIPVKSTKQRQSIWMSHWTRASCRKANEAPKQLGHDPPEVGNGNKYHSLLSGPEMETGSSKFVTGLGEVNKGKRINVMNDNLTMSPKRLRNEMFEGQSSFAMFKPSQDRESVLFLENVVSSGNREGVLKSRIGANSEYDVSLGRNEDHLPSIPAQALPEVEIHERKSQFQAEDLNLVPEQRVKSNSLLERSSRVVSAHVQDDFVRSTSDIVPYEFEVGRSPIQPFFSRLDHINESGSTSLVHEKKMNKNAGLLFRDPSTSNNQLRESFHLMPNRSGFEFLPRQISTRGDSQLEKLYNGSYALPTLPSVHDGETMRIRTTIDSIEEFSRGPPTYTQTTHRFFIKKKTDVNLPDGAQMFRESAISTEIKGKMVTELLAISPDFGFDIKQGVKLLPLDSSTGSEGKESTGNFRTSAVVKENDSLAEGKENTKNASTSAVNEESDSSAETDTMGMDAFCENHLSGVASLQSDKDINEGQKLPASQAGMPSVRQETKGRQMNTELPDINQELTVLPGLARSPDNMETSTSRTQSLDAECFLPHAEHSTNSKSSDCPDTPVRLDPCSRWFKRLKASVSKVEEASSHQKFSKLFNKMLRHSKTSSEPKTSESDGKLSMSDQTAELLRNAESYSTDPARKIQEITLSHVWVQRWFHNPSASPKKNPGAVAVSKPESSEAALDFQKKQFPSTAAMALMGKAMNGFCPCEYRKSGSSVVWNTK